MKQFLIDTNLLIRFILDDDGKQVEKVKKLFKQAEEGIIKLVINTLILAEFVWVLESFYKVTKEEICSNLLIIIQLNFIKIKHKELILKAINIFAKKNVDFVDCLNYVFAQEKKLLVVSFDKHFDTIDSRIRYKL